MHELSIACEIVRQVEEIARANDATRVRSVRVRIGRLSGVVPEALSFAWPSAIEGTVCTAAELQIEDGASSDGREMDLVRIEVD